MRGQELEAPGLCLAPGDSCGRELGPTAAGGGMADWAIILPALWLLQALFIHLVLSSQAKDPQQKNACVIGEGAFLAWLALAYRKFPRPGRLLG